MDFTSTDSLIVMAGAGLAFSIWCAAGILYLIRRDVRSRTLDQRMGLLDRDPRQTQARILRLWREGEEISTVVPHTDAMSRWLMHLRRKPHDAGWNISVEIILLGLGAMIFFVFLVVYLITLSVIAALGIPVLMFFGFWAYMNGRIRSVRSRFDRQLEDALNLIARSLRAGQPLLGAFQLVASEMEKPVSTAFGEICQQQALGVSLEEAVRRVTEDSFSEDMRLFGTSVVIQLRTGGNLADMMNRLAGVIRDRMKLARRVKVLTAQTQFSKNVLLVLPFIIVVLLSALNKDFMDPLFAEPIGRGMLAVAMGMLLVGTAVMNKMAQPRY